MSFVSYIVRQMVIVSEAAVCDVVLTSDTGEYWRGTDNCPGGEPKTYTSENVLRGSGLPIVLEIVYLHTH